MGRPKGKGRRERKPGPAPLTPYWHGGVRGLQPGDLLRPVPHPKMVRAYREDDAPYDPNLVYVTTDRDLGRMFASLVITGDDAGGDLYNVEPVGPVMLDPDYPEDMGVSFACASATVVHAVERSVRMSDAERVRAEAPFLRWDDRSPMYDHGGFMTVSPLGAANGVPAEFMRSLGRWRLYEDILPDIEAWWWANHDEPPPAPETEQRPGPRPEQGRS